jgi:hypothetical protein
MNGEWLPWPKPAPYPPSLALGLGRSTRYLWRHCVVGLVCLQMNLALSNWAGAARQNQVSEAIRVIQLEGMALECLTSQPPLLARWPLPGKDHGHL